MKHLNTKKKILLLKVFIHLGALLPLVNLYYLAFSEQLSADPVEEVIHFTGIGAFNLLLVTLAISPLAKVLKQGFILQTRRLLGLYAFTYAVFHLLNFIAFEIQFDMSLLLSEIIKRPYITVGMVAFIFLVTFAYTSINRVKRKMGKSWQVLHNFNYLVILLVSVHFYWSVKSEIIEPLIYLSLASLLLIYRRKKIKALISNLFS